MDKRHRANQSEVKMPFTAVELVNRKGLNGLIVYSNGAANILRPNHLHYFSGCRPLGSRNAAVVSKSGDVALIVTPEWDSARSSSRSWIKDVRGTSRFTKDLVGAMREFGLKGRIGLAGSDEMNHEVWAGLKDEAEIVHADDFIPAIAKVKAEEEIGNARKAGRAADAGYR